MGDKKNVADYLLELAADPAKLDAHKEDPDGHMAAAGIDAESQAVIKTGDVQAVRAHLGEDDPPGCVLLLI